MKSKNVISVLLISSLLFSATACGGSSSSDKKKETAKVTAQKQAEDKAKIELANTAKAEYDAKIVADTKAEQEVKAKAEADAKVVAQVKAEQEAKATQTNTSTQSVAPTSSNTSTSTSNTTQPQPQASANYVAPPSGTSMNDAMRNKLKSFGGFHDSDPSIPQRESVYNDLNGLLKQATDGSQSFAAIQDKFMNYNYKSSDNSYRTKTMIDHSAIGYFETSSNDAREIYNKINLGCFDYGNCYIFYDASRKINRVVYANAALDDY